MFRCKEFVVDLFQLYIKEVSDNFVSRLVDIFVLMVDDQNKKEGKIALSANLLDILITMQLQYTNQKEMIRKRELEALGRYVPKRQSTRNKTSDAVHKPISSPQNPPSAKKTSSKLTARVFNDDQKLILRDILPPMSEDSISNRQDVTASEYTKVSQDLLVSFRIVFKGLLNIFCHIFICDRKLLKDYWFLSL